MSYAHQRTPTPLLALPEPPGYRTSEHEVEISVVFTSFHATVAALRMAGTLAKGFRAHINLVVPQVIPYPISLDNPSVAREFCEQKLRDLAHESAVDTTVLVYLCRDRLATLRKVLRRGSVVVIGGRRRWWPTSEKRLAEKMRRLGQEVIFADMD